MAEDYRARYLRYSKPPLSRQQPMKVMSMTPIEFLKHLQQRCGEAMSKGDSSPAGMMVNGRNTALGEMASYIGRYLQNSDYPTNNSDVEK